MTRGRKSLVLALALVCAGCGRSGLDLPLDTTGGSGSGGASSSSGDDVSSGAGATGGGTTAGPAGAGGDGTSAVSGAGGAGAAGTGSGGDGPGPPNPVECITCVAQNCPEVLGCIQNPACGQGLVCVVLECGIEGNPDLECLAGCFDGDIGAALEALEVLTCVLGVCGEHCAVLLPGG